MANVKISDLTGITSVADADLFEVSEDNGVGGYDSRKATGTQMRTYVLGTQYLTFTGPTTSTKTYTLPNASATVHTSAGQGDGTASAPSYSFSSDTNTGIYRITTDTLGFSTAGAESMRIEDTGVVSIGAASSAFLLGGFPVKFSVWADGDPYWHSMSASYASTYGGSIVLYNSGGASPNTRSAILSGDQLGSILFFGGATSSDDGCGAVIDTTTPQNWSVTSTPGYIRFHTTQSGSVDFTERMRITDSGNVGVGTSAPVNKLDVVGSLGRGSPVPKTGNFTLADTENWVICNGTGTITVTFPAASSWTGREVMIKTISAQTVISASSNVVPVGSATAGTAILAATAGKWATLVSDGANWVIMQAG